MGGAWKLNGKIVGEAKCMYVGAAILDPVYKLKSEGIYYCSSTPAPRFPLSIYFAL